MSVDHASQLTAVDRSLIRFHIPPEAHWNEVRKDTQGIGKRLTDTLRQIGEQLEAPTRPAREVDVVLVNTS